MGEPAMTQGEKLQRRDFSIAQLKLIRRSVANACTDAEFDEFIAVAGQCGLDPMRRQITPLILHAGDAERRRLIPWATIDRLRVIAARQGDYRPMETAPILERDETLIDPERNPLGLSRAEVRAWKHRDGQWHPVAGEAWWDEYAPLRAWRDDDASGPDDRARLVLDPSWMRMGRVMLSKCAEAQALRRGWPDVLSGLYGEEELHAVRAGDETASERLEQRLAEADQRRLANAHRLWFVFDPANGLQSIARDELVQRIGAFYQKAGSAAEIDAFHAANRQSLQTFWDWRPGPAFDLKRYGEARRAQLEAETRETGEPSSRKRVRGSRAGLSKEASSAQAGACSEAQAAP